MLDIIYNDLNKVLNQYTDVFIVFVFSLFFLIAGAISYFNPEFAWRLELGWRAHDNEPSDDVVSTYKILGMIGMVIGGLLFLVAIILLIRKLF